jgi:hypothetical protein
MSGGIEWPKFNPATEPRLDFTTSGPKVVPNFHKESLDLVEQLANARQ